MDTIYAGPFDAIGQSRTAIASLEQKRVRSRTPRADKPEAGKKLFLSYGCNGCHGGTGGGGTGPPLSNAVWIYGKDDDTLFRLITLGSDDLQKAGYARKGTEGVVGPMPPFGHIIKSDDDLWTIIAFVRTTGTSR